MIESHLLSNRADLYKILSSGRVTSKLDVTKLTSYGKTKHHLSTEQSYFFIFHFLLQFKYCILICLWIFSHASSQFASHPPRRGNFVPMGSVTKPAILKVIRKREVQTFWLCFPSSWSVGSSWGKEKNVFWIDHIGSTVKRSFGAIGIDWR